jgi:hypothetical protein
MRPAFWHRVAGWSLALTGVGHLAMEAFAPSSRERDTMMATMRGWQLSLPGAERNVEELFWGFSVLMGLLLVGSGALISTLRATRTANLIVAAMTLGTTVVAWRYLFAVPGVLTSIAAVAALLALLSERFAVAQRV